MIARYIKYAVFLFALLAVGVPAAPAGAGVSPVLDALMGQGEDHNVSEKPATSSDNATQADDNAPSDTEPQETFGTRALGVILDYFDDAYARGADFVSGMRALPDISSWIALQNKDPKLRDKWSEIGKQLLVVVGGSLAIGVLADLLTLPLRRRVASHPRSTFWGRFNTLSLWLFLASIPVASFLVAALALLNHDSPAKLVSYVVMTVVYALALLRLIRLAVRFTLAPRFPNLRLISLTTRQAWYIQRWLGWLSFVMVFGYLGVDFSRLMKVPPSDIAAFSNLVGLVVVLSAITIIVQKRGFVSATLRGGLSAARRDLTLWQSFRLWLARSWHVLAIGYLVIGYAVTTLRTGGGFEAMQRGTILTLLVLLAMWLSLHFIARMRTWNRPGERHNVGAVFRQVLKAFLKLATWALACIGIASAWGADVTEVFASPWGQRVLGSVFSIGSTIFVVVAAYELLHVAIERSLNRRDVDGRVVEVNPRARTLLPMARNAAILVMAVIVGMVTLSELGVNIAPLLAGAGVLGVAIGFGSQTLMKDFLTGLFIVLEDTIAVGDIVIIGDHSGVVEEITIRTVRLRDLHGNLHVLPFSEITKLVNQSKGFSYALMDLNVAYSSDLRLVMKVMREMGDKLREMPDFKRLIIEPIEVMGVESFGDSSITVRCRIKTVAGKQWDVKRAYMLHIKERFDAERIEIPYPTIMQLQPEA